MADHISKRVLDAVLSALTTANISVMIGGVPVAVTLIQDPPAGNKMDPSQLPVIFAFAAREQIAPGAAGYLQRDLQVTIMLLARPASKVAAQLFEMQLAVEKALMASGDLGGLAFDLYPISADQVLDRGEAVHGTRSIDFLIRCAVPRGDPSL